MSIWYKWHNVHQRIFWQHHNKPIALWRKDIVAEKLRYIHQNPLKAGYARGLDIPIMTVAMAFLTWNCWHKTG